MWWGRYVASCPNEYGALHFAGAWGHMVNVDELSPVEAKAILDQMRLQGAYLQARPGLASSRASRGEGAYGFNKVDKALEIVEEIRAAGEKVIVFTSLRGLYRTLEAAFTNRFIAYVGIDSKVSTKRRNDVVRRFETSDATVLLAGTGTLNRGKPEVKVLYFRSLFEAIEADDGNSKTVLPQTDQPVQLAMFAP